jgi:hypothetical protein
MPEERKKGTNAVEPALQAVNVSKEGKIVARCVEWAGTSTQRRRGLFGPSGLDPEQGIYLGPCRWIHTYRMRFPNHWPRPHVLPD